MADTITKKALQQKKSKKKKEKLERKEERKANNNKGKSLDEMIAYLDENGNLTNIPPDRQTKKRIQTGDIQLGATPVDREKPGTTVCTGTIALFFTDKGFGFITEDNTHENIFVHCNKMKEALKEKDRVSFRKEKTPKGFAATDVEKIR